MAGSTVAATAIGVSLAGWLFSRAVAAAGRERMLIRLAGSERRGAQSGTGRIERLRQVSPAIVAVFSVAAGAVVGNWLAGPVGSIAGIIGVYVLRRAMSVRKREHLRSLLDEQLGEALGTMSAALRAGLSVRRALQEAHRAAEPPLREVLSRATDRLRMGQPLEAALEELDRGIGSPDASLVAALLDVHHRTGGDLPALLDEVGVIVGHRIESRRRIRALTAQGRASGAVLAVLPIAFVGLLSGTGGDGLGAFYRTLPGAGLLLAGLLCELLGFLWISRIVRADGNA